MLLAQDRNGRQDENGKRRGRHQSECCHRIFDFGLILLGHAQRWSNRIFDTLPLYILLIVPGLSGADNYILPYSLKPVSYTHLDVYKRQALYLDIF